MIQTEWFQCPLPAPVTAFPGWNRQEPHRPAVPAEFLPIKFVHAGLGIRIKRQLPRRCVHRQHAIHTAAGLCKHLALLVSVAPKETRMHNDIPLDQLELLISGKENQNEIIRYYHRLNEMKGRSDTLRQMDGSCVHDSLFQTFKFGQ
jgi:hypothetical protein